MLSGVKNHRCCGGVISRHLTPGELRDRGAEVARGDHDDPAGIEMLVA